MLQLEKMDPSVTGKNCAICSKECCTGKCWNGWICRNKYCNITSKHLSIFCKNKLEAIKKKLSQNKKSGCLFVSTPAAKDADPVTQVAIALPTPVTGNAPLDPAYADEENIYSITSKKQRSVVLETGSFIALNEEAVKPPTHDRAAAALLDSGA